MTEAQKINLIKEVLKIEKERIKIDKEKLKVMKDQLKLFGVASGDIKDWKHQDKHYHDKTLKKMDKKAK